MPLARLDNDMLRVVGVVISYLLARVFPGVGVGRLISSLDSSSEDAATAAYMALVKLGPRHAERLLAEARQGRLTSKVLQVLGDLGDATLIPDLKIFAASKDPEVAAAARESIEALQLLSAAESPES